MVDQTELAHRSPRRLNPAVDAARLNQACFCITLDRAVLSEAIAREAGDEPFGKADVDTHQNLFSNVPVFLPAAAVTQMHRVVGAIEEAAHLPNFRSAVLGWAPAIAREDHGPLGALMGYDFHLDDQGPKLIEVNTNAGGAFLNALLARAQRACCIEVAEGFGLGSPDGFDATVAAMFRNEWRLQRGEADLRRLAIIDDRPDEQYLYPEFVLARQMLIKAGIDAVIADPSELSYVDGRLRVGETDIDLVYNRLVDFSLERPEHLALRKAYEAGSVVVTPNPHSHALFADKRNLTLLSNSAQLASWGLSPEHVAALGGVPLTKIVTPENADELWSARKGLFFKPTSGHGGKAVYRGDKVTKGVWEVIAQGDYVAQAFAAPGERMIEIDGQRVSRKMDVRLYTYEGRVLLVAARLYQGQTTNFRTPGGGFAPVLVV